MRPFSDFLYGFRSSLSTADLRTVVTDRIARVFNRSEATTWAVVLDISKGFDSVWHTGFLHKFKSDRISGRIFGLISSFLRKRQIRVVLDGKSSQEPSVNVGVPRGSILCLTLFLLYINDLPDAIMILLSMLMILLSIPSVIRHLICGNNWNLLLKLNLIYETLWTGAEIGFWISMLQKFNWFCFTSLITPVLLMWKWMGLFLSKNHILRC